MVHFAENVKEFHVETVFGYVESGIASGFSPTNWKMSRLSLNAIISTLDGRSVPLMSRVDLVGLCENL